MIHDHAASRTDSQGSDCPQQNANPGESVLFVLPEIPWPLRRSGIALRFTPILEHLARSRPVDVLILGAPEMPTASGWPQHLGRSLFCIPIHPAAPSSLIRKIKTVLLGLSPWGIPFGASPHIARRQIESDVLGRIESGRYSAVIWGPGFLDIARRVHRKAAGIRFVVDFTDSPALAVSRARFDDPFIRLFRPYTVWKWRRLERALHRLVDASIYVSPIDAAAAGPTRRRRIQVIPNGISPPQASLAIPSRPPGRPTIGFLGDMSYPPNVSAAIRLANRVIPRVRREFGAMELLIIGRNPVPEIRRLQNDTVTVTGEVQDIWEFIARVTVFAFPMMEGSGLQNKILEAMYAGVPVVATSLAASGLEAIHGKHLLIADSDESMANELVRLISDEKLAAQLAAQAADFVMQRFSWPSILPRYEAVITGASDWHDGDPNRD